MGTTPNKKTKNSITLSHGVDHVTKMRDIGDGVNFQVQDRGFAQKSPTAPEDEVTPQAHASVEDEADAVEKNSKEGEDYTPGADDETNDTE